MVATPTHIEGFTWEPISASDNYAYVHGYVKTGLLDGQGVPVPGGYVLVTWGIYGGGDDFINGASINGDGFFRLEVYVGDLRERILRARAVFPQQTV